MTGADVHDYGHMTMGATRKTIAAGIWKPVARLAPLASKVHKGLLGSVLKQDDVVAPIGERWDVDR